MKMVFGKKSQTFLILNGNATTDSAWFTDTKTQTPEMELKLLLALGLPIVPAAAETVLGIYVFHRHGDRTAKKWPPVRFTDLGADEVYSSGLYYRSRYVSSNASQQIRSLSTDE
ncbi:unnamed protein product, partial [Colletotrichum noveboracense]